jgi:transposase InsO family protein
LVLSLSTALFDNGSQFSSEFFELLQSYGVAAKPITIKKPQANAFVERIHQVMGDSIHSMELSKRHFDDTSVNAILKSVAYGLRATYHLSLAASPGQLVFGRDMIALISPTGKTYILAVNAKSVLTISRRISLAFLTNTLLVILYIFVNPTWIQNLIHSRARFPYRLFMLMAP